MDYPHPLLAITNDGQLDVSEGYDKGIGIWDKQVIKYGYGDFAKADEQKALMAILTENASLGLEFISDSDARQRFPAHRRSHTPCAPGPVSGSVRLR